LPTSVVVARHVQALNLELLDVGELRAEVGVALGVGLDARRSSPRELGELGLEDLGQPFGVRALLVGENGDAR
jgi:hypothetical protein